MLARYYEQICGPANGKRNLEAGAQKPYDFSSWKADAAVVNLGTNDHTEDKSCFRQTAADFLRKIRLRNPDAEIVWAFGMIAAPVSEEIQKAVEEYRSKSGDRKVFYLQLPEASPDKMGSRMHPGRKSHEEVSEVLTHFLQETLWGENG